MKTFKQLLENQLSEASVKNVLKKTLAKAANMFIKLGGGVPDVGLVSFVVPLTKAQDNINGTNWDKKAEKYNIFVNKGVLVGYLDNPKKWQEMDIGPDHINHMKKLKDLADTEVDTKTRYIFYYFMRGIGYEADVENFCKQELKTHKYATLPWKYW